MLDKTVKVMLSFDLFKTELELLDPNYKGNAKLHYNTVMHHALILFRDFNNTLKKEQKDVDLIAVFDDFSSLIYDAFELISSIDNSKDYLVLKNGLEKLKTKIDVLQSKRSNS